MTLTPGTLTAISLVLLALGLLIAAGTLIVSELRRARSGQAIGKAIQQGTVVLAAGSTDAASALDQPYKPDADLPFHWLDSRIGRALVADEDRNLIDQCGLNSRRAQLIFLVTRVLLALLLPTLTFVLWGEGQTRGVVLSVFVALFVIGFMLSLIHI